MTNVRTAVLEISKSQLGVLTEYGYTLKTSDRDDRPITTRIKVPLSSQVIETLCAAVQEASEATDDHARQLRSIGQTFYRLLFNQSEETKWVAQRLAAWRDPLIISSDEVEIPWELLHDDNEFLGIRIAVGRQMVVERTNIHDREAGEIRRALIVSDPNNDLPAAADEAARLAAFLDAQGIECTHLSGATADWVAVGGALGQGNHDIFHYSGHVGLDGLKRPALQLHRNHIAREDLRAVMATKAPPIVFINGCRSASHMTSVCSAFLDTGSRIVMGTRYRVDDEAARDFSEQWYGNLLTGMTAGAALRTCRSAQRDGRTGTWAAFVLFGQPATQLWPSDGERKRRQLAPEKVESPPGRFWAEHADWLGPGVTRLIRRITDSASGLGIVTTFHLAAGLLDEETPLSAAIDSSNVERQMVVDTLRYLIKPGSEVVEPFKDDSEMLSDNVRQIFEQAISSARADKRAQIEVDDVANAFMAGGGGHAGELLTLLDVKMFTDGSLFDSSGALNAALVAPETERAIRSACFLSSTRGEVINSYSLLLGCALASSPVLREALLDQGPDGERVVRSLFPEGLRLSVRDFSRRAHIALDQAHRDGHGIIDDAHLLAHVLSDPGGAANGLVQGWGLNPQQLRDSFLAAIKRQTENPQ